MKKTIIILTLLLLLLTGCQSVKCEGFSVGVLYLNTDIETFSSHSVGPLGQLNSRTTTEIEEIVPVFLINFKL